MTFLDGVQPIGAVVTKVVFPDASWLGQFEVGSHTATINARSSILHHLGVLTQQLFKDRKRYVKARRDITIETD